MKNALFALVFITFIFGAVSCSDDDNNVTPSSEATTQKVIDSYVNDLVLPNLKDLKEEATDMNAAIDAFLKDKTADNLKEAQEEWKETREAWEQSEAMLFGPVEDNNFDPRIDTWPVDYNAIDSVRTSGNTFTNDYINSLPDELKGFHPIEFYIFGKDGNAAPDDFSDSTVVEYLKVLSQNLKGITDNLYSDWDPAGGNFAQNLLEAGTDNSNKFESKQAVMIEIVNAMAGIVSEVGDSKLKQPYLMKDPSQAESPFSKNSFVDFTNNITGAQNVYLGGYDDHQGTGISAFVSKYNKSLDAKIKAGFTKAINNLKSYNVPYGEAIINNRSQVQKTIDQLADLKSLLENDLVQLIQLQVKN